MPPTLARRYIFKLLANLTAVPVYLVMEAILPRALGPGNYGNYSFATSVFQQLSGFLDMGTSTCFYNSLSRRQTETGLFSYYARIGGLIAILTLLAGLLALWQPVGKWLLPDMPLWIAPLAAGWAYLTWAGRVLRSANDALGATIPSELWRSAISILGCLALIFLFFGDSLNLRTLFVQQYLLLLASAWAFWHVCKNHWRHARIQIAWLLSGEEKRAYHAEFFNYSHPLFIQALLSFLMLSAERWLLQWFDGSAQQGFFALSQKVSMACFLFVSAMTPLLMREFSIAWGRKDIQAMASLLKRLAPVLYCLAAYFSCFTLVEGAILVEIFGGSAYLAAILPVQIMALYPIHQVYGQVASSVFHATGKTRILRNMTALECCYGFATAWFLLAPGNLCGLNLGATGLAIKTVAVQMLSVNIYLWLASRFIPFSFWRNLGHQVLCVLVLLGLAAMCHELIGLAQLDSRAILLKFILSGSLYSIAVLLLCILSPELIGLSRQDCRELVRRFLPRLAGKLKF